MVIKKEDELCEHEKESCKTCRNIVFKDIQYTL